MKTEARQETLTLIEEVVTRYCGVQRQGALEMIACEVDNHIDRLLKEHSRKLAEMELRYESNSPIGDCHV